jgi:hypothetical protein
MENETEAVEKGAEITAPVESAPTEQKTDDAQPRDENPTEQPAGATTEPENKVSDTVPYGRFKEVNEELKQLREQMKTAAQPAENAPAGSNDELPFDEATSRALDTFISRKYPVLRDAEEAQKFVKQHADDLKDPIVNARTIDLIKKGVDREQALKQAQKELDERLTPIRKEALSEGVQEGQDLARKKEQMGAVGSPATNKVDLSKLSAEEYAKHLGLSRTE